VSSPAPTETVRQQITALLGEDIWRDSPIPSFVPRSREQFALLITQTDFCFVPVGAGSSCSHRLSLGDGTFVPLSTIALDSFEIFPSHQTVAIGAGCSVYCCNQSLAAAGFIVPALHRFDKGTVGGRLASVSSQPEIGHEDGWMQSLLEIEVLLASGEILKSGSHCIKDVAGYDLRHLFTGSRGAFGIILSAAFRCRPLGSIHPQSTTCKDIQAGQVDPKWRLLLDPNGRFRAGISAV
jgi:FAD/FMN-containing dehydrogenase